MAHFIKTDMVANNSYVNQKEVKPDRKSRRSIKVGVTNLNNTYKSKSRRSTGSDIESENYD